MGCSQSKTQTKPKEEPKANEPHGARNTSLTSSRTSGLSKRCNYCGLLFTMAEYGGHTVVCEEREVTCHHSWCRKILRQGDLRVHMHECLQSRKTLCPKCGETFPAQELSAHRGLCDVVSCEYCTERVIPRMVKYCPNIVLGKTHHRVGPFATERLRDRFLYGIDLVPSTPTRHATLSPAFVPRGQPAFGPAPTLAPPSKHPGGGPADMSSADASTSTAAPLMLSQSLLATESFAGSPRGPSRCSSAANLSTSQANRNTHYQVARVQHLWRWAKAKAVLEDLMFRIVYKEIDGKKETFSIFKAHDHKFLDEEHRARQKKLKSSAPVQAVAPTQGHYFPPKSTDPITPEILNLVIQDFTHKVPLPYHAVWRILTDANNLLKAQPNITRLTPPEGAKLVEGRWMSGGKVVVVGDLHGQLQDLLTILSENALPSERCLYVFNGDFVDRGHHGLEIIMILFMMMIVYPKYVALNRGNHECEYMNEEYGFDVEVQTKYDRNIFKLIQRAFCSLPLATLVGNRVFVVHGGIPRRGAVTFDDIDMIQRFRQIPMPEHSQPEEDEIFQDLMWSDPMEKEGWLESDRGVGAMFGPDVTNAFLKENRLELVIRSHEEFSKGHEFHHGSKLITVFSASNYDGPGSNAGATITLMGDSAEYSVHTYSCDEDDFFQTQDTGAAAAQVTTPAPPHTPHGFPLAMSRTFSAMSFGGTVPANFNLSGAGDKSGWGHFCASLLGSINLMAMSKANTSILHALHSERRSRDDVMQTIREQLFERRHRLLAYFTKIDRTQKGSVWKMEWVETMHMVLNLNLPWFFLRPFFTHTEPITHRIRYVHFLARFHTGITLVWLGPWRTRVLSDLYYGIFGRRKHGVAKILSERPDSEPIGYNEFSGLLRQVTENLTDNELFHLFLGLADDGKWCTTNGFITGASLQKALEVAAAEADTNPELDDTNPLCCGWDLTTMDQLSSTITRLGPALLRKIFKLQNKQDCIADFDAFLEGMAVVERGSKRPLGIRKAAKKKLWEHLIMHSVQPEQGITVDELLLAFAVRDYTSLSERRDSFVELTSRLLSFERSQPIRRRFSSTFVGFGPTDVPNSPLPTDRPSPQPSFAGPQPNSAPPPSLQGSAMEKTLTPGQGLIGPPAIASDSTCGLSTDEGMTPNVPLTRQNTIPAGHSPLTGPASVGGGRGADSGTTSGLGSQHYASRSISKAGSQHDMKATGDISLESSDGEPGYGITSPQEKNAPTTPVASTGTPPNSNSNESPSSPVIIRNNPDGEPRKRSITRPPQ